MRVAAIQLNSTADKSRNLEIAGRLVAAAAGAGAELVVLPEKWNLLGGPDELTAGAETLEDGASIAAARGWARDLGIDVVAGSVAERVEGEERLFNSSCVVDREGTLVACYRKIHMFDVDVGGVSYRESAREQPGDEVVAAELSGIKLGLTVCYDLRFPELFRILALAGAQLITVPAAFTMTTGRDHWEVLLRARAIEDQCFVVAPNQVGEAPPHYHSYGRSMIVDPWGTVLAQAPDRQCFVSAEIDLEALARVRASVPALANRRPEAYDWPQGTEPASTAQLAGEAG